MGMAGMGHPGLPPGMPAVPGMMPQAMGAAGNGRCDFLSPLGQPAVGLSALPQHQQARCCAALTHTQSKSAL
jgi:hypothetical protein